MPSHLYRSMLAGVAIFGLHAVIACGVQAAEIHVDITAGEGGTGSADSPYNSLQQAADRLEPGDTCIVHPGRYRESVTLTKSGTAEAPIRIVAQGAVVLDGTEPLTAGWSVHQGAILKTKLPGPAVEQAFAGGIPLSLARWPNATFHDTWDRAKWLPTAKGSKKDLLVSQELAQSGIDFTGATAVLNVGHQYKTWTRTVLAHKAGSDRFTYDLAERLGDGSDDGKTWWDDRFYLTNTIKALDAPGEFYHDAEAGWFYLVTADGTAPEPGAIQVKRRDYGLQSTGVHDLVIEGVAFFACTFSFNDADRVVAKDCDIRFPAFSILIRENLPKEQRGAGTPITSIRGRDNAILGCTVAYSSGEGIRVRGERNRVEDCLVHDVGWSGTIEHAGIRIQGQSADVPAASVVRNCTVFNVGNVGIYHQGQGNIIEHNLVHHTGLACHDIAAIHTGGVGGKESVVRYNVVHHSSGIGIRGDDQTRYLTIHHNLIYACQVGIICKGDFNRVYNNTILGTRETGRMILPTREEPEKWWTAHERLKVQNLNSLFFNNYLGDLQYRGKPIPQNTGISHNIVYANANWPLQRADEASMAAGTVDARPTDGSPVIDAGRVVEGLTDDYLGKAPDVGAYEHGRAAWTYGSQRQPLPDQALRTNP